MSKAETFQAVLSEFSAQVTRLVKAAQDAHKNFTGDEVKSEGKYDTRGTEAAYLAGAQAEQAEKAQSALADLQSYQPRDFDFDDVIALGAIVETEQDGELTYYFLLPHGGGVTVEHDGFDCSVLTPDAPLYQQLLGHRAGETLGDLLLLGLE